MDSKTRELLRLFDMIDVEKPPLEADSCFKVKCRIELTLNHPETVKWKKLTYKEQALIYSEILDRIVSKYPSTLLKSERKFEHGSALNKLHVHAYFDFEFPHVICPAGLVSEIVSIYWRYLPEVYRKNPLDYYNVSLKRIKMPSVCCQYYLSTAETRERYEYWETYINKCDKNARSENKI